MSGTLYPDGDIWRYLPKGDFVRLLDVIDDMKIVEVKGTEAMQAFVRDLARANLYSIIAISIKISRRISVNLSTSPGV